MLLAGIMTGLISSSAFGAEEVKSAVHGTGFEVITDRLVFDEKGDDHLLFCNRRFDITSYTLIKNERGAITSFEDVDVPCEAMVSYYKKPGKSNRYVAVSIEVKGEPLPLPE